MPALPFAQNVARVNVSFSLGTPLTVFGGFRFFWKYQLANPSIGDFTGFCNLVASSWSNHFAAIMSSKYTLTQVVATDLTSATGIQVITNQSVVGTDAGQELSVQDCVLVNHKIARHYRGGKPRSYLPLGTAADVQNGKQWTGAFVSTCQNAYNGFESDLKAGFGGLGACTPVNVSYYQGATEIPNPPKWHDAWVPTVRPSTVVDTITSSIVSPTIGAQRRRTRYGS